MATTPRRWNDGPSRQYVFDEVTLTQFEKQVQKLKLSETELYGSTQLQAWAKKNRNYRWIPENLLEAWHLEVEDYWC